MKDQKRTSAAEEITTTYFTRKHIFKPMDKLRQKKESGKNAKNIIQNMKPVQEGEK
jgi:hypothetical protein